MVLAMFPADAGMNRWGDLQKEPIMHVPRRRGDEPDITDHCPHCGACSPQTRG